MNENEKTENLDFLVIKSRDLLQEQLKSYESANNKAGLLISISSLLIPIAISFISNIETSFVIKIGVIAPTLLMTIALTYLLKVLLPKGLDHGFNFDQFDKKIDSPHKDLLLYEIGANKDSYRDNTPIIKKQNENFKKGVKLIYISAIILFILVLANPFTYVTTPSDKMNSLKINNLEINNLKINNMNYNNENSGSSNGNQTQQTQQNQQSQQSSQQSTTIPSVPGPERANIEKGNNSTPLIRK